MSIVLQANIKITAPADCGNAPKKKVLKDFHVAIVTMDRTFLLENVAENITWNIIGDKIVEGKENFLNKLEKLHTDQVIELSIRDIITHGWIAAVHGKVIGTKRSYDFCHVYKFTSASKTAKIKEITSYLIG